MTKQQKLNVKKWLKALRSGTYIQGKYVLHSANNKFCCLGVACELAVKDGLISAPELQETEHCFSYDGRHFSILPESVRKWLGLTTSLGESNSEHENLGTQNDSGKSFEQIAAFIESKPEGLFV